MDETHYETRESMTWNQSADLDFEAARAEWERQGEGAPEPSTLTDADAAHRQSVADYEAARQAKADRYRDYAERAAGRSAAAMDREHAIADMIPMGQPILIGHHSEGRARRDRSRMDNLIRKAIEEDGKAAYWQRKAAYVENARIVRSADPDAVRKLREKLAGLEAQRERRKALNAQLRKGVAMADLDLTRRERSELAIVHEMFRGTRTRYDLTNVGAEIRRVKERIAALEAGRTSGPSAE
jgi:hypothetical protein